MSESYNFALTRQASSSRQTWRRNQNTVRFRSNISLGPVSHTVLIAIMLAVLGMIYLTQITRTSTYGYQLNDLNAKKEQLANENRDLEVESAKLQALERVQQSNVANALTTPSKTDYAQN
jgi:cell division protein FtsL